MSSQSFLQLNQNKGSNMSKYNLSPELNDKLKNSLANQGQFLEDISFVYALQAFPVLVPSKIFFFDVEGHKTLPMFTTEEDLAVFEKSLTEVETEWELRPIREILTALMQTEIASVAFNPKLATDESHDNTVYFDKESLLKFISYYTGILNEMLDPENVKKERLTRKYLVPTFVWTDEEDNIHRGFANLTTQDGQEFIPIFDNLNSFAAWYNEAYFVDSFKENRGQVLMMDLKTLRHPDEGENVFGKTDGVTINPIGATNDDYQKTLMFWNEIG